MNELNRLDELMSNLGGTGTGTQSAGPCGLLLEHLQAARRDFLGSMHAEYWSNLKFAKESVTCIADQGRRTGVKQILQGLIDSEAAGRL